MNNTSKTCSTETLTYVVNRLMTLQFQMDYLKNKLSKASQDLKTYLEEDYMSDKMDDEVNVLHNFTQESNLHSGLHQRKTVCGQLLVADAEQDVRTDYPWTTCDYRSLPPWLQDNDYIKRGYRPLLPSFLKCSWSIFQIHTETGNIWTHLLGCLLFIALTVYTMTTDFTLEDKLILLPFCMGAIICLGFSTALHTLQCHSEKVSMFFTRMDYCGIIFLITGSFIPWLYYVFYCSRQLKIVYLSAVLILSITAMILSFSKNFTLPIYRPVRTIVFSMFGLSGIVPGFHFILINGWQSLFQFAVPLFITAFLYLLGAVIYASRVPESIFPGRCDIWFQSHQFFHVLVVIATLVDYIGLMRLVSTVQSARTDPQNCKIFN